jgi:hypothetical protein
LTFLEAGGFCGNRLGGGRNVVFWGEETKRITGRDKEEKKKRRKEDKDLKMKI